MLDDKIETIKGDSDMKNIPANRIRIGSRSSLVFSDNMEKNSGVPNTQTLFPEMQQKGYLIQL